VSQRLRMFSRASMARSNSLAGRHASLSLWKRVAALFHAKKPSSRASVGKRSARVQTKRRRTYTKRHSARSRSTGRHSGGRHARRRISSQSSLRRPTEIVLQVPQMPEPKVRKHFSLREHLPKVLFKEIVIPLPKFSHRSSSRSVSAEETSAAISSDQQTIGKADVSKKQGPSASGSGQQDLADLLSHPEDKVSKKDPPSSASEKKTSSAQSETSQDPSGTPAADPDAALRAAIASKRKHAQIREMALKEPSRKREDPAKEAVARRNKEEQKKADADAEAALEKLASAAETAGACPRDG